MKLFFEQTSISHSPMTNIKENPCAQVMLAVMKQIEVSLKNQSTWNPNALSNLHQAALCGFRYKSAPVPWVDRKKAAYTVISRLMFSSTVN